MKTSFTAILILVFVQLFGPVDICAQKAAISIDAHRVKVDSLLWDLEALSKPPAFEWVSQKENVHSLLYTSVDYEGRHTRVFAWYSNPDIINGRAPGQKKFPGVVLIHGGGGMAFKQWVEKWARAGYAAIAMDLSGNDGDMKKLAFGGADQDDSNKFQKIEHADLKDVWTYHAVSSAILAHSFLLNRPEVDETKTCVTGISWGGYLTCIVAGLDNRFKAAVPVYGCAYYDESDVFKVPLNALSADAKRQWMKYFDPSVYLPFAQPVFLFIDGNKDKFYNVVPFAKTYSLVPPEKRTVCIRPDMKHSHEDGWEPSEIRYFFESVINKGSPLLKVENTIVKDQARILFYHSSYPLSSAIFYYSNDSLSTNAERKWDSLKIEIDPNKNKVACPVPENKFKYGFFYLTDSRNTSVSSEFIIH